MLIANFNPDDRAIYLSGLYQWDYGQQLKICGLEIQTPQIQVHFAQSGAPDALIVIGEVQEGNILAEIPNIQLRQSREITAYVYPATESEGETIREVHLKVKARAKPEEYDAPDQKNALQQILDVAQGKADGAEIVDGVLQLTAGGSPVGDPVELPGGAGDMEPISNEEIDQTMKGEADGEVSG